MWNGVHIFTDHRNLAYIFDPEACVTSVSKALAQRLEGWKCVLGQYRYTICHILGDRNAWGDLLSRWVSVPALPVRAVAVFSPCDQDDSLPSKAVVRQAQQKALATHGTEVKSFESAVGLAVLDDEGLFRIHDSLRYACGGEQAKRSSDRNNLTSLLRQRHLLVALEEVQFAKNASTQEIDHVSLLARHHTRRLLHLFVHRLVVAH